MKRKKIDRRVKPLAEYLCVLCDGDWGFGWRLYTNKAKDILRFIDGLNK